MATKTAPPKVMTQSDIDAEFASELASELSAKPAEAVSLVAAEANRCACNSGDDNPY